MIQVPETERSRTPAVFLALVEVVSRGSWENGHVDQASRSCSSHKEHGCVHFKSAPVTLLRHSRSQVRVQSGLHVHRQGPHTAGCAQAARHLPSGTSRQWTLMHVFRSPKQSVSGKVPSRDNC